MGLEMVASFIATVLIGAATVAAMIAISGKR